MVTSIPAFAATAMRIIILAAPAAMHCFTKMMLITSTDKIIAANAITMKLTGTVLSTITVTSLSLYSTAILSDILALNWKLMGLVKIAIMLTSYLLSPIGTRSISTSKATAH